MTIKIFLTDVKSSEIGAGDLVKHMESALKDATSSGGSEELHFYKKAVKMLRERTIRVLGIVDKNTTGLTDDKWEALVYKEGTPHKRGMSAAGGSFGIGKNAPYLVSGLKTVCYSTRYLDRGRQENFIARCKISAHPDPRQPRTTLQHIGFGTKTPTKRGCRALPTRGKAIHSSFRLDDVGSGIFILGFEPLHHNWVEKAKRAVACNFFAAIHEKKLRIHIDTQESVHEITHETLDDVFEKTARREPARHYYHLIRSADSGAEIQGEIGKFSMLLDVGKEDYPNRIAYVNRRGMLVTDVKQYKSNPFHVSVGVGWAKYVAVLRAADDKTDEQIRKMEPPNHKSIEYKRIIDVQARNEMKARLDEVRKTIEEMVSAATKNNTDKQEINLDELWEVMPAETNIDGEGSGGEGELTTRVIQYRPPKKSTPVVMGDLDGGSSGGDEDEVRSKDRTSGNNLISGASADSIFGKARAMRHGSKLRVAFTPTKNDAPLRFVVKPAGEETKPERAIPVSDAQVVSPSDMQVSLKGNILSVTSQGTERIVVDLEVGHDLAYTGYEMLECVERKKE